jgi:uncharacterized membrane protein (UPF0127 family)
MTSLEVTFLQSLREKTIGLLGANKAHAVVLKTRFGIHTFGMKFSIDVLVLNQDNTVMTLVENLHPNLIFVWPPRFDTIIELPAGGIKKHKISIGEKLKLIPLT